MSGLDNVKVVEEVNNQEKHNYEACGKVSGSRDSKRVSVKDYVLLSFKQALPEIDGMDELAVRWSTTDSLVFGRSCLEFVFLWQREFYHATITGRRIDSVARKVIAADYDVFIKECPEEVLPLLPESDRELEVVEKIVIERVSG